MKRWDEAARRLPVDRPTAAVEVGVWKGKMSRQLLTLRPRLTLFMVDLWRAGSPGESWYDSGSQMAREAQGVVDSIHRGVCSMAAQYPGRAHVVRDGSTVAADRFDEASLDLVFIDADHSQLAVQADIQAWRGKVRPGGWIGGHDFGAERFPGVESAVRLSFRPEEIERGENATWWVRR